MDTTGSIADRVYDQIKALVVSYRFKPSERINEGVLARQLGVSRTPLREALNRLHTEGLLSILPGKGFFCRDLDVEEIFSLYEMRKIIEVGAIGLTVRRATDAQIGALLADVQDSTQQTEGLATAALVELDEAFHERLMGLSGNAEMRQVLHNVNQRIRFVRWIDIDMNGRPEGISPEHLTIVQALADRDGVRCAGLLEKHIERRREQINSYIKEAYAKIYM